MLGAVRRNAERFKPQGIANALWALATTGMRRRELENQGLSVRLFEAIRRNAERFNPQGIANVLWALTTMGMRWGELEAQRLNKLLTCCCAL
ncbi:DUF1601 domain-containing protein [Coxiella burnetii]|uniref:DUF1601 domain-containing protein n=1 Tax=Coxiella burnetii TaxID=777 RepID=UPI000AC26332|nr:DUF1601 domain-containing protein [Coxiella burnetii]